ncbi:unnamed protein product [Durusdinium trenchii]|uniref:Uncharacterized protein n=1 Tax=Durusdinium trenchii TaxID=1381693 RepID=A0ABP0QPW6_9DINO
MSPKKDRGASWKTFWMVHWQLLEPEPTTDKFVAIMAGPSRQQLPGFALCSNPAKSFDQLQTFGSRFLERFEGALLVRICHAVPVLGSLSFVDTPGVLSGDKQRMGRSYDFEGVMGWFAEHADLANGILRAALHLFSSRGK